MTDDYDDDGANPYADEPPAGPGPVARAVLAQLARWDMDANAEPMAAAVLDMAISLDDPGLTPTPRAMLHAQFRMTMAELTKLAPQEQTSDGIDEVKAQREARRRGA